MEAIKKSKIIFSLFATIIAFAVSVVTSMSSKAAESSEPRLVDWVPKSVQIDGSNQPINLSVEFIIFHLSSLQLPEVLLRKVNSSEPPIAASVVIKNTSNQLTSYIAEIVLKPNTISGEWEWELSPLKLSTSSVSNPITWNGNWIRKIYVFSNEYTRNMLYCERNLIQMNDLINRINTLEAENPNVIEIDILRLKTNVPKALVGREVCSKDQAEKSIWGFLSVDQLIKLREAFSQAQEKVNELRENEVQRTAIQKARTQVFLNLSGLEKQVKELKTVVEVIKSTTKFSETLQEAQIILNDLVKLSERLTKVNAQIRIVPDEINKIEELSTNLATIDAEFRTISIKVAKLKQKQVSAKNLTCIKGNSRITVLGINAKCPAGYKKKT